VVAVTDFYEPNETPLEEPELEKIREEGQNENVIFFEQLPVNDEKGDINLSKYAAGLANNGGGSIFLGISKDGTVEGVADISEVAERAVVLIEDYVEESGEVKIDSFEYKNDVVEIRVQEYHHLPHSVDGRFYIWRNNHLVVLTPYQVWRLMPMEEESI